MSGIDVRYRVATTVVGSQPEPPDKDHGTKTMGQRPWDKAMGQRPPDKDHGTKTFNKGLQQRPSTKTMEQRPWDKD